jgi:hypothetical protein
MTWRFTSVGTGVGVVIEVLLVALSLTLGGTVVFFMVCQYFRRQFDALATQHRQEKDVLETQIRELNQLVHTLAGGRAAGV